MVRQACASSLRGQGSAKMSQDLLCTGDMVRVPWRQPIARSVKIMLRQTQLDAI